MIDTMPESIYQKLKIAVETGKWADGNPLSQQQRENCLQAVMAWQAKHAQNDEHFTIGADGKLIEKSRAELKRSFSEQIGDDIVRVKHDDL